MLNRLDRKKEAIKRLDVYRHDPDPVLARWAQVYYEAFTKKEEEK